MLFYHVRLHCYVVVELKTEKVNPEFAGKLNFYVTAVNKQMKTKQDNLTIGILICKDKDDVVDELHLMIFQSQSGLSNMNLQKYSMKNLRAACRLLKK